MIGLRHSLRRAVPATPAELAAALWSFAYFFALLAGYYVLRPLRDQMGIAGGTRALPWLFSATFVTLLVAQPLYGALVARLPRERFIPLVYHFFVVANLAVFWLLLTLQIAPVLVARVFFVWVSVFNLFAVVVFGSFMADLPHPEHGRTPACGRARHGARVQYRRRTDPERCGAGAAGAGRRGRTVDRHRLDLR